MDLVATVQYRLDGSVESNLAFQFEQVGNCTVGVRLFDLSQPLAVGDTINIGGAYHRYRLQKSAPSGKWTFSLTATYYPGEDLYSQGDLVVSYDDTVFNEP